MSTPAISPAELCKNVQAFDCATMFGATFNPGVSHPDLPPGETGILESFTSDGLRFVFAVSGFTVPGHGFFLYQDTAHMGWADRDVEQKDDYKNYLQINFRNRLPITIHVGGKAFSLGSLIKMMKLFTR